MAPQQSSIQKSKKRGYVAFLICGVCVALNVLAYLPAQSFEQSEATEFTVTLLLLLVFVVSALIGAILAIKNLRDFALTFLLLATIAFALTSNYTGTWGRRPRVVLELSYAAVVLTLWNCRAIYSRTSA